MLDKSEKLYKDYKDLLPAYIECSEGWFPLIKEACNVLLKINLNYPNLNDGPIKFRQIKEKFGGLRLYKNIYPDDTDDPWLNKQYEILNTLEAMSWHTCEVCGLLGEPRNDLYWRQTLCDDHYLKNKNRG